MTQFIAKLICAIAGIMALAIIAIGFGLVAPGFSKVMQRENDS